MICSTLALFRHLDLGQSDDREWNPAVTVDDRRSGATCLGKLMFRALQVSAAPPKNESEEIVTINAEA